MTLSVQKLLRQAEKYTKLNEFGKSEALYKEILLKFPKNIKALKAYQQLQIKNKNKKKISFNNNNEKFQDLVHLYNMQKYSEVLLKVQALIKIFPYEINLYNLQAAANAAVFKYDDAIKSYERIIKINPNFANAYFNIGVMFQAKNYLQKSVTSYKNAIFHDPNYADAYNNLGNVFKELGKLKDSMNAFEKAIRLKPNHAFAYNNIGNLYAELGERKKSIKAFNKAISIIPDYESAIAAKLHQLSHICDWEEIEKNTSIINKIGTIKNPVTPHFILSLEDAPERHRIRSEIYSKTKYISNYLPERIITKIKSKRIRIAYISSDFKIHPVALLIAKVIELHNRNNFEIYGYSIGINKPDEMNKRLKKAFDKFEDVKSLTDKDIASKIQKDEIDILIDLNGFTDKSRPGIFAYKPSKVQINYLGYPGTMGSEFMDYIVADHILIPNGFEHFYTENIIRLPNSYMPTDNSRVISNQELTRKEFGLPDDGIVFCCFNNNYKISFNEFNIWMRILLKNKNSVLWLKNSNEWSKENIQRAAKGRGVDPLRIIFAEKFSMEKHLASYTLADIFIDTFSYNAHTTASEALWAGLPVITKVGKGFASRVAASLLNAVGLQELITSSEAQYENLILNLTKNPDNLTQIKQKLKQNLLSQPLFDTEKYTSHLEEAYKKVYENSLNSKNKKDIIVEN
tara:strand:+ start:682 stop:2736 length:2055 start_codon:yes stop_codon:yes gene_type:complete